VRGYDVHECRENDLDQLLVRLYDHFDLPLSREMSEAFSFDIRAVWGLDSSIDTAMVEELRDFRFVSGVGR